MKLYDGAIKILNALIKDYKERENMTDADIIDCLDFTKKVLNRIPIITENAKVAINKAIDDKKAELEKKK